jgi:hypothetical protein
LDRKDIDALAEAVAEKLVAFVDANPDWIRGIVDRASRPVDQVEWLTVTQKAAQLNVSRATIYRNARRLGGRKVSGSKTGPWRFPRASTLPDDDPSSGRHQPTPPAPGP